MSNPFPPGDAERLAASRTLRRLVCFVAAALDVRFAFVAALEAPESSRAVRTASLWLAKDFGLRTEFGQVDLPEALMARAVSADWTPVLHRFLPDEQELAADRAAHCVTVTIDDSQGRVLGHLGLLGSGLASDVAQRHRLRPLARLAAMELLRWVEGRD